MYATIVASLQEFENQKIEEWGRDVEGSSQAKLRLPLLTRSTENAFLSVNFDPGLVKLLRETKYFLLLGLQVPDTALDIYRNVETFRSWTGQLDMVVNKNNLNLARTLPVDRSRPRARARGPRSGARHKTHTSPRSLVKSVST